MNIGIDHGYYAIKTRHILRNENTWEMFSCKKLILWIS